MSMIDRRPARILAMQALCQLEVLADDFLPQLDGFLADECREKPMRDYARSLALDAWQRRDTIDAAIQEVAEHWELKRMATVDRNALRIAVCELLHRTDVPPRVVINEAVEIGKTFGTADSAAFINGILDAIFTKQPQPKEQTIAGLTPTPPAAG
jgi:transcription antitermination protein NusB